MTSKFNKSEIKLINQIKKAGELIIYKEPKLLAKVQKMMDKSPDAFCYEVTNSGLVVITLA
jgi:hypothetical protein